MSKFEDVMSKLATDTSENPLVTADEVNELVADYNAKVEEINKLTQSLKDTNDEYDKLKSKVIDNLFSNSKGKASNELEEKHEEEPKKVTFKDLIDPQYSLHNK